MNAAEMKQGIVAIKASIERIKEVVDSVARIMDDGKVDFRDIVEVPGLIVDIKNLVEVIKQVPAEAKDLDNEELKTVLVEGVELLLYIAAKLGVK